MKNLDREIERVLSLLRNKIRERGFTQLQVQEQLHWGRSYISQLVTRQKALRLEQILCILDVIGVTPTEFFGELYGFDRRGSGFQHDLLGPAGEVTQEELRRQLSITQGLVESYAKLLVSKRLLDESDVEQALRRVGETDS
ncbi:MAG: helix-turn-helix domain-containing protein [Thermoanaerobaculia bacterium]|nr:helix-turn-helix domain-containing protein [Thermoanaerobaculia bacterium]